jgi:hypothetical protein
MFSWLDLLLTIMQKHPKTLFVIRAHPDEMREGKKSRESVQGWIYENRVNQLPNVLFIDPDATLSSYDLIRRSKFVLVYNSSIGLEAALLGIPVVSGGKARYTRYSTVFFPPSQEAYRKLVELFLSQENIEIPEAFRHNAYRFLYYQYFCSSILFDDFIEAHPTPGYVQLKPFSYQSLMAENSPSISVIVDGVLQAREFLIRSAIER